MRFVHSAESPPDQYALRQGDRWHGPDCGLVFTWIRGLEMRSEAPSLAEAALRGELPILVWRGGIEGTPKATKRVGTLWYYAMWKGLRGEDLDVALTDRPVLTCARTGLSVTFEMSAGARESATRNSNDTEGN